ncbi:Uncharacterised protein [Mycobacterium tuberculosis]|nr:Uncharacterised protein [Mycobacterium tuberculosis]CKU44010.1 Uncharacterised protein [Mycobacterium tuberculosis]CKU59120.1 Uncharacterised protein [Mycobacterium tuberculosis]
MGRLTLLMQLMVRELYQKNSKKLAKKVVNVVIR